MTSYSAQSNPSDPPGTRPDARWQHALALAPTKLTKPDLESLDKFTVRAYNFLQSSRSAGEIKPAHIAVAVAYAIYQEDGRRRFELEARLLHDEPPRWIAIAVDTAVEVVELYAGLFYDVEPVPDEAADSLPFTRTAIEARFLAEALFPICIQPLFGKEPPGIRWIQSCLDQCALDCGVSGDPIERIIAEQIFAATLRIEQLAIRAMTADNAEWADSLRRAVTDARLDLQRLIGLLRSVPASAGKPSGEDPSATPAASSAEATAVHGHPTASTRSADWRWQTAMDLFVRDISYPGTDKTVDRAVHYLKAISAVANPNVRFSRKGRLGSLAQAIELHLRDGRHAQGLELRLEQGQSVGDIVTATKLPKAVVADFQSLFCDLEGKAQTPPDPPLSPAEPAKEQGEREMDIKVHTILGKMARLNEKMDLGNISLGGVRRFLDEQVKRTAASSNPDQSWGIRWINAAKIILSCHHAMLGTPRSQNNDVQVNQWITRQTQGLALHIRNLVTGNGAGPGAPASLDPQPA